MTKVSNFDVLKEMGERNLDIRGFAMSQNFIRANLHGDVGEITLAVNPQTVHDLAANKPLIGMLIITDRSQFDAVKAEMEEQ